MGNGYFGYRRKRKAQGLHEHMLPLFITSVIAYIDRVNIGYAALTMNKDLGFTAEMFGLGAGIFFAGYFLFEVPGALIAEKYSPRIWLARIMITWGAISGLMAFMHTAWQFYLIRFMLGAAEASLYPVIYATCIPRFFAAKDRARAIALLLTSLQVSAIIGGPLAGLAARTSRCWGLRAGRCYSSSKPFRRLSSASLSSFGWRTIPEKAKWLDGRRETVSYRTVRKRSCRQAARSSVTRYGRRLSNREVLKLAFIYFLYMHRILGIQLLDAHGA